MLATIQPKVEIRVSATPQTNGEQQVNVPREKVIEEEMIKENIVLNPALDFKRPSRLTQPTPHLAFSGKAQGTRRRL